MNIILTCLAFIAFIATLIPFSDKKVWWVRNFDFIRLQVLVLALLTTILLLLFAKADVLTYLFLIMMGIVMVIQTIKIIPYTLLGKKEVTEGRTNHTNLSMMVSNVLMHNRQADACIQLINTAQPDFVLLVEVDTWWISQLKTLYKDYPYQVEYPLDNTFGMLLLSKHELINPEIHFLVENEVPSIHTELKLTDKHIIRLFCLHPIPPTPPIIDGSNEKSVERDVELIKVAKLCKGERRPVIVLGDLNDVAWSSTTAQFQHVSRLLDPRRGRGLYNSFHAHYFFLRFPLDHIFHSNHFQLLELKKMPNIGSDHFPIWARLSLPD